MLLPRPRTFDACLSSCSSDIKERYPTRLKNLKRFLALATRPLVLFSPRLLAYLHFLLIHTFTDSLHDGDYPTARTLTRLKKTSKRCFQRMLGMPFTCKSSFLDVNIVLPDITICHNVQFALGLQQRSESKTRRR